MQNSSFVMQNSSFFIQNSSFAMHTFDVILEEATISYHAARLRKVEHVPTPATMYAEFRP